jgi:hypothetical protein
VPSSSCSTLTGSLDIMQRQLVTWRGATWSGVQLGAHLWKAKSSRFAGAAPEDESDSYGGGSACRTNQCMSIQNMLECMIQQTEAMQLAMCTCWVFGMRKLVQMPMCTGVTRKSRTGATAQSSTHMWVEQ